MSTSGNTRNPVQSTFMVWQGDNALAVDFGTVANRLSTKEKAAVLLDALNLECPDVTIDLKSIGVKIRPWVGFLPEGSEFKRLENGPESAVKSIAPNGAGLYVTAQEPYFHTEMA